MRARQTQFSVLWAAVLSLLALGAAITLPGCSSAGDAKGTDVQEHTGSLGLTLQAAPGVSLNLIYYSILGGNGFSQSSAINVANSTRISAVFGGIPAGSGYTITLAATDTGEGNLSCSGSANFQVEAGQTTTAQVSLSCRQPATTGSVAISGSVASCPSIAELSITPAEVLVGSPVSLVARATNPDATAALSYYWLATSGTVANAASASTQLTCTTAGPVTVTLTVSDGACQDSATAQLTCTASNTCGNGQVDAGEQCDDGNQRSGDGCSSTCVPDDDLRTPGDDRAGYFRCNTSAPLAQQVTCGPGQGCCDGIYCAASCQGIDNEYCDGPEDCKNGGRYCAKGSHGAYCNSVGLITAFCHHDADCVGADPYVPISQCHADGLCGP